MQQPKPLVIIQARLGSTRFPNKVMQTVGGIPMVKRVFDAAKAWGKGYVIVAWPERYPDLNENDVLGRFRRIVNEFTEPIGKVIRLTADCPMLTPADIEEAYQKSFCFDYYYNGKDGYDVQCFTVSVLFNDRKTDREHVIRDTSPRVKGFSVDTREDLEVVRNLCTGK